MKRPCHGPAAFVPPDGVDAINGARVVRPAAQSLVRSPLRLASAPSWLWKLIGQDGGGLTSARETHAGMRACVPGLRRRRHVVLTVPL